MNIHTHPSIVGENKTEVVTHVLNSASYHSRIYESMNRKKTLPWDCRGKSHFPYRALRAAA